MRSSFVKIRCSTAGGRSARVGKDPDLDEAHRLIGRGVRLGVERARSERHALDGAGRQRPVRAADVVVVPEAAFDDVGQPLHVAMRVKRPDGARDQAIVVEDAHRPERVVLGVAVLVEAEVPPRTEPAALGVEDLAVAADGDHLAGGSKLSVVGVGGRYRLTPVSAEISTGGRRRVSKLWRSWWTYPFLSGARQAYDRRRSLFSRSGPIVRTHPSQPPEPWEGAIA